MATMTDIGYMQSFSKFSNKGKFNIKASDSTMQENLELLQLYDSVFVPMHHRHRIIETLISIGHATIDRLISLLADSTGDKILMNQYIHNLLYDDTINFEINVPLDGESTIWIDMKHFD